MSAARITVPAEARAALLAAGCLLAITAVALLAPIFLGADPMAQSLGNRLLPPAWLEDGKPAHLLGTDHLGRDLLARTVQGLRVSLVIGLIAASGAGLIGVTLGMLAGYHGGRLGRVVMRLADIQLAFPLLVLAIAILGIVGTSVAALVIVLCLFGWAVYARVVRAAVLVQRQSDYILAARVAGAGHARIMFHHLLPNVISAVIVLWTFSIAQMIILEGALSFLGLGVKPPDPSLGSIMNDGRQVIDLAWWLTVFPGLLLVALVVALNALGDALRDWLDPRSHR